jgi:hypothetical protein
MIIIIIKQPTCRSVKRFRFSAVLEVEMVGLDSRGLTVNF